VRSIFPPEQSAKDCKGI